MRIDPRAFVLKNEARRLATAMETSRPKRFGSPRGLPAPEDFESNVLMILHQVSGVAEKAARREPHGMWHIEDEAFGRVALEAAAEVESPVEVAYALKARIYADLMCNARIVHGVMIARGLGRMQSVIASINSGDLPTAMPLARLLFEESLEAFHVCRRLGVIMGSYVEMLTTTEEPFRYELPPEVERVDAGDDAPDPGQLSPLESRMRNFLMGRRVSVAMEGQHFHLNRFNILSTIDALSKPGEQQWLRQIYGDLSEMSHPSGPTNELFTPYSIADGRRTYRFSTRGVNERRWTSPADHEHPPRLALGALALGGQMVISVSHELDEAIARLERALIGAMAGIADDAQAAVDRALRRAGFEPCTSASHNHDGDAWPRVPVDTRSA